MKRFVLAFVAFAFIHGAGTSAELAKAEKGTITYRPACDQKNVPERYRLAEHKFDYELSLKNQMENSGVTVYRLTFPSPVKSDVKENNTVHAEFYVPKSDKPLPVVLLLDITAGDARVPRTIASYLAQQGVAGLFVYMPYYGPRRPPGCEKRLLSMNYRHSFEAVRQTVLDMRRAAAWLESRKEIDPKRLGILGTSLGSFMSALTAQMEPKFSHCVVLLGGGGLIDAFYDDPRAAEIKALWEKLGGTKDKLKSIFAPVDPITCAANLKGRKLLIIAAKKDEIVPPKMAELLWEATGKQKIVWYDCNHYSAVLYIVPALGEVVKHVKE